MFKKLFLTLICQNDLKRYKKIISNKNYQKITKKQFQ